MVSVRLHTAFHSVTSDRRREPETCTMEYGPVRVCRWLATCLNGKQPEGLTQPSGKKKDWVLRNKHNAQTSSPLPMEGRAHDQGDSSCDARGTAAKGRVESLGSQKASRPDREGERGIGHEASPNRISMSNRSRAAVRKVLQGRRPTRTTCRPRIKYPACKPSVSRHFWTCPVCSSTLVPA